MRVKIGSDGKGYDIHLAPGQNVFTGISHFEKEFGESNSLERDLFNLASGIYATDLSIKREEREHYIRNIQVDVEVVNIHAFERVKDVLERALYTVSRDNWGINFLPIDGQPVPSLSWQEKIGAVLLFSGGLDSMCGASEFLKTKKELVLVSHNSKGNHVTDACQRRVHKALEDYFEKSIKHIHIMVFGRNQGGYSFPKDDERENTQRTRSFLFLCLAALVTRRSGFNKVLYMAENGQFAIHLPLNQARIGPFSTHTADPEFVLKMEEFFKTVLNNPKFELTNPFLYYTKAEVFALLPTKLQKESKKSASCWMYSRIEGDKHCGYCIPCITRRIALEYNDIVFKEYAVDIFRADLNTFSDDDDKKRNIIDYLEFIVRFKSVTKANKFELMNDFPELYSSAFDSEKAIKLYQRIATQSFKVFEKYPQIKKILG